MKSERYELILSYGRWWYVLGVVALYGVALGVVRYLGITINGVSAGLGLVWVIALALALAMFRDVFDTVLVKAVDPLFPQESIQRTAPGRISPLPPRTRKLLAALVALTITAVLSVLFLAQGWLTSTVIAVMVMAFVGVIVYAVPPFRLLDRGFGELTLSILFVNLVPMFAFSFQAGELHRFIGMLTFPLTLLHLSMQLAVQLPTYGAPEQREHPPLMLRLGWENGMTLHNYLLLGAFALMGISTILGLPSFITLPVFLLLPIGLGLIWYFTRIATGAKPNWNAVIFLSVGLFAGMIYLMGFGFWTN